MFWRSLARVRLAEKSLSAQRELRVMRTWRERYDMIPEHNACSCAQMTHGRIYNVPNNAQVLQMVQQEATRDAQLLAMKGMFSKTALANSRLSMHGVVAEALETTVLHVTLNIHGDATARRGQAVVAMLTFFVPMVIIGHGHAAPNTVTAPEGKMWTNQIAEAGTTARGRVTLDVQTKCKRVTLSNI